MSPFHHASFLFSPALFIIQETSVCSDLSLQPHLGVKELAVALALGGQSAPHLLELILQPSNHLGKVLQLTGVQLLGVLKGVLKAFLLKSKRKGAFTMMTTQISMLNLKNHVETSFYDSIIIINYYYC